MSAVGKYFVGVSFAALASQSMPFLALAQTVDASVEDDGNVIIVTAQKREQSLQDVAASIAAFGKDTIEERGLDSVENVVFATPGVNFQETAGVAQISIRGVGLLVNTGVAEPNVATHIDGIFQPRASATSLQFLDLERVEVLRGPQGTLYGRNTTGGSINFISAKPGNDFEGMVSAGIGRFSRREFKGYLSGPIIEDKVALRVAGFYEEDDGYYRNITLNTNELGKESWGIKGALRIAPTEAMTIDLSATHQKESAALPLQTTLGASNPFVDQLIAAMVLPAGSVTVTNTPFLTAGETAPTNEFTTTSFTGVVNFELSDTVNFKSLTGYTDHDKEDSVFDADGTSLGIVNIGSPTNPSFARSTAFSQEFNISGQSLSNQLEWLMGLYYFDENYDVSIPALFPSPIVQGVLGASFAPVFGPGVLFQSLQQRQREETESFAAFTDLTFSVSDRFRLGLGLRRTEDTKKFVQSLSAEVVVPGLGPVSLPSCQNLAGERKFKGTNLRVRGEWDPSDDALLYGQWQNGFKDGGINISQCGDVFPKEEIEAFEIGAKTTWLGGDLVLNASAFYYNYDNLQILSFRNATDAFVDPVPKATIKGAELELIGRPAKGLSLDLGISILDGTIDEFSSFDQSNPLAGVQNLAGNELPNAPDFTIAAGAEYEWDTDLGTFRLRGEVFHSASYNFRPFGNVADQQNAYTLVNLYAGYTDPSDTFSIRGYIKNVTDEEYLTFLLFSPTTGQAGHFAPPLTWGLEASAKF